MNNRLHNPTVSLISLGLLGITGLGALATAAEKPKQDAPLPVRELFVPFDDLQPILEGAGRRAFLTRAEYEALLEKRATEPPRHLRRPSP